MNSQFRVPNGTNRFTSFSGYITWFHREIRYLNARTDARFPMIVYEFDSFFLLPTCPIKISVNN